MRTTRVNFRIPEELLEKADVAAKVTHRNRTDIVIEALREYLANVEDEASFKEELVELNLEDEIDFDILQAFIGRHGNCSKISSDSLRATNGFIVGTRRYDVQYARNLRC